MKKFYHITLYFMFFSFIGFLFESIYVSLIKHTIVTRGILYGPFNPIYGFGAILILFVIKKISKNNYQIFLYSFLILTIFEYLIGTILEVFFNIKAWNHSKETLNIQGKVCLYASIAWGLFGLGMASIKQKYFKFIDTIQEKNKEIIVKIFFVYLIIDLIFTLLKYYG